jgi:hypothetical protein
MFTFSSWPQPSLQPTMIGFYPVVRVLLGDMRCGWDKFVQRPEAWTGFVSGHLDRRRPVRQGPDEESAGGGGVALLVQQYVDHLPVLVDRPDRRRQ